MSKSASIVIPEQGRAKKLLKRIRRFLPIYFLMLPGLAYLVINNYMPMPGLILAFKKYNAKLGIYKSPFVGFSNFKYLFATRDAFIITRNTILYNLVFIVVNTFLAIAVAIILSEITGKVKKFYQSAILLPNLVSSVIIGYLVYAFFSVDNGFINNQILAKMGKETILWYQEPKYWPFILVFVGAWKSVGYNCIVYLSTLLGFDRAFYEAAAIDGATKWQQITKITIPLLRPTIIMLTMMAIGRIFFSDFGLFYQVPMNQGALFPATQTIDTYVYRALLQQSDIAKSSAAGLYQSVIGFILVLAANYLVRKIDKDSALF